MDSILILFAASAFALKGVFAKLAYAEGVSVEMLLFIRFLSAMPIYWLVAYQKKAIPQKNAWSKKDFAYAILMSFTFLSAAYFDFIALSMLEASLERVILFTFPAFVILIDVVLERKSPSKTSIIGFVITELGLCLVLGVFTVELPNMVGCLWAFACAVVYAIYLRLSQPATVKHGSIQMNVVSNTITTVISSAVFITIFLRTDEFGSGLGVLYCVIIGIFCTAIPFLFLFEGVRRLGAQKAALLSMPGPVVTIIAAYFVLGERLSIVQLLGIAVVMGGVALVQREPKGFGVGMPKTE